MTHLPLSSAPWLAPVLTLLPVVASPVQDEVGTAEAPPTSFTIPLEQDHGYVILPISINGSEPLPILLDSGMPSPGIALFHGPHVDELDLDYVAQTARVGGAGGGKSYEARLSMGATFEMGGARIDDSMLIVMPPIPYFDIGLAGIIGYGLLESFVVTVDRDAGHVVLTAPGAFEAPEGAAAVPLELKGNMPYVDARLPGAEAEDSTVHLVLDTGARHAVSLHTTHPAVTVPENALVRQVGRGLSGELHGKIGRVAAFELGGHRLESVVASFVDAEGDGPRVEGRDGNLGIELMNRFRFTLDYSRKTLHLLPSKRFGETFESDMTGLRLDSEKGELLRVAEVLEGSPAAEAGIAVGDVVLEVNGKPVTGRSLSPLSESGRRPGALKLKVMSEGEEARVVELELRRLV